MIGLDTNVLIRYVMQDDPAQTKKATEFIEKHLFDNNLGYITLITLAEFIWVLKSCYGLSKGNLVEAIEALLTTKQFLVERKDAAWKAMRIFQQNNGDFSDALITVVAQNDGCTDVVTFDKRAKTVGMTLL